MNQSLKTQISDCEARLKQAMLESDVATLDELLATDLVFTNHLGHCMSKHDDLEAHRSGLFTIKEIALSDQKIKIYDGVAIVTVQAHIHGSYAGTVSETDFRFTRVWKKSDNDAWQVIAGHSSVVV